MRSSYAKYDLIQCNVLEIMIDPGSYNEGIRNLLAEDQAGGSSLLFSDGPAKIIHLTSFADHIVTIKQVFLETQKF